ncbi:MAG TPA: hypothetical protein VNG51_16760, partial [Ktedonobacteraceae bacterium]|nr:hypothetical protein [Ktedonobacteraceae bacterium]
MTRSQHTILLTRYQRGVALLLILLGSLLLWPLPSASASSNSVPHLSHHPLTSSGERAAAGT